MNLQGLCVGQAESLVHQQLELVELFQACLYTLLPSPVLPRLQTFVLVDLTSANRDTLLQPIDGGPLQKRFLHSMITSSLRAYRQRMQR